MLKLFTALIFCLALASEIFNMICLNYTLYPIFNDIYSPNQLYFFLLFKKNKNLVLERVIYHFHVCRSVGSKDF
jgi:hypothetical protein